LDSQRGIHKLYSENHCLIIQTLSYCIGFPTWGFSGDICPKIMVSCVVYFFLAQFLVSAFNLNGEGCNVLVSIFFVGCSK